MIFNRAFPYSCMRVGAFIEEMERLAPPLLAEEFDRGKIGLVVEGRTEIAKVCCALDATPAVVDGRLLYSRICSSCTTHRSGHRSPS